MREPAFLLAEAANRGMAAVVAALLEAGLDPDLGDALLPDSAPSDEGISDDNPDPRQRLTARQVAARNGHEETVRALIEGGASTGVPDDHGRTAMELARLNGHKAIVAMLQGAGPGGTPPDRRLHLGAEGGDMAAVIGALEDGAKVDAADSRKASDGFTALMLAARAGHLEIVRELLTRGAGVDARDTGKDEDPPVIDHEELSELEPFGKTALLVAAEAGQADVVTCLLQAGAGPGCQDTRAMAISTLARDAGHADCADLVDGASSAP